MAKKKHTFRWVRDAEPEALAGPALPDDVDEGEEEEGRPERAEHRAAMEALKDLANRISALPQGQRRVLPLDEETQQQLDLLAAANHRPDRRRVLMRAKLLLGRADLARVEAALAGDTPVAALERRANNWRTRLMQGDDSVLQELVTTYPEADRQALRSVLRAARGEGGAPPARQSQARLLELVRETLKGPRIEPAG